MANKVQIYRSQKGAVQNVKVVFDYTCVRGFTIPSKKNNMLSFVKGRKCFVITNLKKKQEIIDEIRSHLKKGLKRDIDIVDYIEKSIEPYLSRFIYLLGKKSVFVVFYLSDDRRRDLDTMLSTILDCLVEEGIIEDDGTNCLSTMAVTKMKCEKGKEGCDIFMSRA